MQFPIPRGVLANTKLSKLISLPLLLLGVYSGCAVANIVEIEEAEELASTVRAMAEWERTEAVVFSWSRFQKGVVEFYPGSDLEANARREALVAAGKCDLVNTTFEAITAAGSDIIVVDIVDGEDDFEQFVEECEVTMSENLTVIDLGETDNSTIGSSRCDDLWVRDDYPATIYQDNYLVPAAVGAFRCEKVAEALGIDSRVLVEDEESISQYVTLYKDGGNFLTNGHGSLFVEQSQWAEDNNGDEYYETIVDNYHKETAGITDIVKFPNAFGHIDYSTKLLNEETVVLTIPNEENIYYEESVVLHAAAKAYFSESLAWTGRPYKVFEIPEAPSTFNPDYYIEAKSYYANSLIVNDTVLVGAAHLPGVVDMTAADAVAKSVYEEAMPGYKVVMLPYASIFHALRGSIHCLTTNIGDIDPIYMAHKWLDGYVESSGSGYVIVADINASAGLDSASVYWRVQGDTSFSELQMSSSSVSVENTSSKSKRRNSKKRSKNRSVGEEETSPSDSSITWSATIPESAPGTTIEYYIKATDNFGDDESLPFVAPQSTYSFSVVE